MKKHRYDGYILLESSVALSVVAIITIMVVPLMIFMIQQKQEHKKSLEAYRFMYEASKEWQETKAITHTEKESNGVEMTLSAKHKGKELLSFTVDGKDVFLKIEQTSKEINP